MPKPRRKHPAFASLELSVQGRQFLRYLEHAVGDDLAWQAVGSTRERFHVFEVRGDRDRVVLVEAPAAVELGLTVGRMGFRHHLPELPLVAQVEVAFHRLDAWIWAEQTGDHSLVQLPERARRRETDRRSEQTGNVSDHLSMMLAPRHEAAGLIAGLEWSRVEALMEEAARRVGPARRARVADDAVACPSCGRLCSRAEAVEHVCDGLDISVN